MGIKQFKMDASTLLIAFSVIFSFCDAQITVGDNDRPNAPSEGDVDSRFFNIDFGNISLGGVAETAIGTTLGQLGTGFLQDCLGIGKRSIIMDRLVNKRSAQEGTGEITDADSRIISPQDVDQRLFCLNNNNNGGGGFGGFGGAADLIAEHVAVTMIIGVTILVINVIKDTIITILEDLVVIRAEVVTSEVVIVTSGVVIAITEIVIAITEIVTVEVDIQIAIHVPVHIQALVEDLATNAITLVDGGEMGLTTPILGKHLHLPPLQIMAVVLLTLVTPKIFEFAFIIFLVQNISAKIMRKNKKSLFSKKTFKKKKKK